MFNPQERYIPIVDEQDEIIGFKKRKDVQQNDIYRVASAILYNSKGEILIAQRGLHKKNSPWKWNVSVAWTVEQWETYDSNIQKEVIEELWIQWISLQLLGKKRIRNYTNFFVQVYLWICNQGKEDFQIEYPEVNDILWVNQPKLEILLRDQKYDISKTLIEIINDFRIFEKIDS